MRELVKRLYYAAMYNTKLITKLLVSYLLLILTPLLLLAFFSFRSTANTLLQQFEFSSEQALEQASAILDQRISNINATANKIAFHRDISEKYLHNQNAILESYSDYDDIAEVIRPLISGDDLIYSIEMFTSGRYTLKQHTSAKGLLFVNLNDSYAQELNRLIEDYRGEILWLSAEDVQTLSSDENNDLLIGAKYIYTNAPKAKRIGIVAIGIKQEDIHSLINGAAISPNGLTVVLDKQGEILTASNFELIEEYGLSRELLSQDHEKTSGIVSTDAGSFFINSSGLKNVGWTLVSVVPNDELLKTSISNRRNLVGITIVISFFFLAFAALFSGALSKRILSLANTMKKVHLDNYTPLPSNDGTDEISELITSYNYLLEKINVYADSQVQMVSALKSQQIKALQAEINPHFLYNTLDLLNWIALDYDAYEISEIVTLLSRFYKLSLNKGIDVISTKDAIQHTEIYIKLQNYRFENPIELNLDIDPEIYRYRILNLLLQPIVENAVMHGILKKQISNGTISVIGRMTENRLMRFEITDNGIGMSPEQITELTDTSASDNETSFSSHGYGIRNVNERIKLYYGEEYGLEYESTTGEGTSVIIEIPTR